MSGVEYCEFCELWSKWQSQLSRSLLLLGLNPAHTMLVVPSVEPWKPYPGIACEPPDEPHIIDMSK